MYGLELLPFPKHQKSTEDKLRFQMKDLTKIDKPLKDLDRETAKELLAAIILDEVDFQFYYVYEEKWIDAPRFNKNLRPGGIFRQKPSSKIK